MIKKSLLGGVAAAAVIAASPAMAQTAPGASAAGIGSAREQPSQGTETNKPAASEGDEVIVTGTRTTGLRASDSPAPIQVLGADTLKRVGQTDLMSALAQTLPTIQVQAFGNDQTAFHPQIKLRGLNPNQTLVLLNGKRRHGTANVVVTGGISSGGASPDIGLIPEDAIDHVEVLQDGAAAQYGTDAIAGVVNFILKKNDHGGQLNATVGQYEDGDGLTWDIMGNIGIQPIPDMYLSVSAERKFHDFSFRGDVDPRVVDTGANTSANTGNNGGRTILTRYPGVTGFNNYPYVNRIFGDGKYNLTNAMYNAGYTGISGIELYSFGSYSRRVGATFQNYRLPNVVYGKSAQASVNTATPTGDIPFPQGFAPQEVLRETDYSVAGGIKGEIAGTTYDLSTTYGRDFDAIYVENSANAALYFDSSGYQTTAGASCVAGTVGCTYHNGSSPSNVRDGNFIFTQITSAADFTHKFDVGFAEPVNVAVGAEYRHDRYQLQSGDPASYYVGTGVLGGGIQSFFGYAPTNASSHKRHDISEYIDISAKPVEALLVDGAVRHENYSDFGSTTVFKVTSRYDFSPAFAIRGTASTGFRAPTLPEEYYSGINVSVASLSGVFAPNSSGAASLGIGGLKPEKSTNFSIGFVAHPIPRLTATLDLYSIFLRDRIVQSGAFVGYSNNCKYLPGGYTTAADASAMKAAFAGACTGVISPSVLGALAANGVPIQSVITAINGGAAGSLSINTFVNGVNTVTHGADFLTTYSSDFGPIGNVDWSLAVNYNYTKINKVAAPPANVNQAQQLLDLGALTTLVDTTPKFRVTAGALFGIKFLDINLRESFYGPTYYEATEPNNANNYVDIPINSRFITDVEVTAKVGGALRISLGANNVFNSYPNQFPGYFRNEQYLNSSTAYVQRYPSTSPYGVMGGYYYGRIGVKF
ncbi:TonB-dependent receptor plug domain-containing protein [Sphingomonas bacterium]|uniref:TonB-dependent receptor plug domain-containing protein n=1 Tax=Sphingomonas bacterium TaxID=1895847 RepID=UPI0015773E60|nr:TonB-dependent receptor [Sphingomonas bacterium]